PACCHYFASLSFSILPRPPRSPLFPYTTLFRSRVCPKFNRIGFALTGGNTTSPHKTQKTCRCGAFQSTTATGPVTVPQSHPHGRSEEHTSELQSRFDLVCRLLLEKKNKKKTPQN